MIDSTILLRQAHPSFMDGNRITSQVFMPFPKDKGFLSVYDGDMINPGDAHTHFTKILGFSSHSVWGVTKAETAQENLLTNSDPQPNFTFHALIDFTKVPEKTWRKIAKRLQSKAIVHGCQYLPQT